MDACKERGEGAEGEVCPQRQNSMVNGEMGCQLECDCFKFNTKHGFWKLMA